MPATPWEGWLAGKHTPPHLLLDDTWYMISASTASGETWFTDPQLAEMLGHSLEEQYARFDWDLELYVVMPDHYHVVARSNRGRDLPAICKGVHGRMAAFIRRRLVELSRGAGRAVSLPQQYLNNYWDTCLNTQKQWLDALEYVRTNPIRAGLIADSEQYPFRGPQRIRL